MKYLKLLFSLGIIVLFDQLIKGWAIKSSFFRTNNHYVLGNLQLDFFWATCIILFFVLLWTWFERKNFSKFTISFVLIFASLLSNLIDRLIWAGVIDYFQLIIFKFTINFNLADLFFLVGLGIYVTKKTKEN